MYRYVRGNIFESPAKTLVNTVNTAGAMGKGLAREFKRLFPDMFKNYQQLCESGEFDTGKLWLYPTPNKWVLNFPTKKHWRQPSRFEYIEQGLHSFVKHYDTFRITSVAFPRLGCGNGELDWAVIRPLMSKYLKKLPIDIFIYEAGIPMVPEHKAVKQMREWLMSEPTSYPFDEFQQDIKNTVPEGVVFKDKAGSSFSVEWNEVGTTFVQSGQSVIIPWVGNELGSGWRELWQYIRERGVCTTRNLLQMGIGYPMCVIHLLKQLPYIQDLEFTDQNVDSAIQLKPTLPQPRDLFGTMAQEPQPHRL